MKKFGKEFKEFISKGNIFDVTYMEDKRYFYRKN